jgi:hypothetical protein
VHTTVRIAAGGGFEIGLPGGNDEKEFDYEINEKILRKSQAPTEADSELTQFTTSSPHLRQCKL